MDSIIKGYYIDIDCICIDYCTDEERYIDKDSHFVHIPRNVYENFLELKTRHGKNTEPLYIGIRNVLNKDKKLHFGRVEPSVNSSNSNHTMALLPKWVFDRLEITDLIGKIDIVYIKNPQKIDYIKVRGDKSSYVKFRDIKTMLENKLGSYNCLNLNEKFHIEDVTFTVTEIKNKDGNDIEYGSLHNSDVKIDFELPDDLVEIEKEKKKEEEMKSHESKMHFGSQVHSLNEESSSENKEKISADERETALNPMMELALESAIKSL